MGQPKIPLFFQLLCLDLLQASFMGTKCPGLMLGRHHFLSQQNAGALLLHMYLRFWMWRIDWFCLPVKIYRIWSFCLAKGLRPKNKPGESYTFSSRWRRPYSVSETTENWKTTWNKYLQAIVCGGFFRLNEETEFFPWTSFGSPLWLYGPSFFCQFNCIILF